MSKLELNSGDNFIFGENENRNRENEEKNLG